MCYLCQSLTQISSNLTEFEFSQENLMGELSHSVIELSCEDSELNEFIKVDPACKYDV